MRARPEQAFPIIIQERSTMQRTPKKAPNADLVAGENSTHPNKKRLFSQALQRARK